MDGCFSSPSYNSIGDPFIDCKENTVHKIKGKSQFGTSTTKGGQTGSNWGPGPREFIGMAGSYQEKYKEESQYRLANTKQNLISKGFTYSSPAKKSCGKGDLYGTISGGYEYIGTEERVPEGFVKQKFEGPFIKRNIITSPSKRGTYGYAGTLMGGKEIPAFEATTNPKVKAESLIPEKLRERAAFKSVASQLVYFDSHEHVAASKVYGRDDSCQVRPENPSEKLNPKERVEQRALEEGSKSWKPPHIGGSSKYDTIHPFPEQHPEPYDERMVNQAMLPNRRNPVKLAMRDLPASLQERRAFRPTNGPKSKLTKGTSLVGINKHTVT